MTDTAQQIAVGIDVGGTHTRCALVESGRVVGDVWRGTSRTFHSPSDFLLHMTEALAAVNHVSLILPIGLALPGLVDQERGRLTRCVNLPFLEGFAIRAELARTTGCAVHVMTDAVAATWGEYRALPGPPTTFAHLRIGTGIALGIVRDGSIVDMDTGRTRHLEILVVEEGADALECRCGLRGCLETVASGRALAERWSAVGGAGGVCELRAAFMRGESLAVEIVERARRGLQQALHRIAQQFGVTHCTLGGGAVEQFPELVEVAIADARAQQKMRMERALLGDDAGVIGAARLALDR